MATCTENCPNILTILPDMLVSDSFYNGLVMGVQETADADSNCYESVSAMLTLVLSADIDFDAFATATTDKGGTATDMAYMMTMVNLLTEAQLVFFNMYADCYLELLMIQVGKITNSSAAGMNFGQTVLFTLMETYQDSVGNLYDLNVAAADYEDEDDDYSIGLLLGYVFSENMQWTVPTFKVNEFGGE